MSESTSGAEEPNVTRLLEQSRKRVPGAEDVLYARVYRELLDLARAQLRRHARRTPLGATELVHESYLRLVGDERGPFENRDHFFSLAATIMRRVLVDAHRERLAQKRGGAVPHQRMCTSIEVGVLESSRRDIDALALCEALAALSVEDPRAARVVELRLFAGMSHEQVAQTMEIASITSKRDWKFARVWLLSHLELEDE